MRFILAIALFFFGSVLAFMHLQPDILDTWVLPGMFLMVTGAVQMAFIVGGGVLAHTPPALEGMFRHDTFMLWGFAPLIALVAVMLRLALALTVGQF